jgi:hypothetical protein
MNELLARSKAKKQKLTKAERLDASDQVKANLVTVLQKLTAKLAAEPVDSVNISHFRTLVETASRLFGWPAVKAVDLSAVDDSSVHQLHTAINLALIRTTPEQLREKARARQTIINVSEESARLAS